MNRKVYPTLPRRDSYYKGWHKSDIVLESRRGQEEHFGYHDDSYQGNRHGNQEGYHQRKPENRLAVYQEPGYFPINVSNFLNS